MEAMNETTDNAKHELEGNTGDTDSGQTTEAKHQPEAQSAVSYAGEVVVPKVVSPLNPRLDPIAGGL